MNITIPNVPKLFGKVVGKVLHVPVDVFCGVRQGFTNKTEEQLLLEKETKSTEPTQTVAHNPVTGEIKNES